MGKTFFRIFRFRNIIAQTWFLSRLFVYSSSFISQILDFLYWMVCIFIFHGVTVKTENTRPSVHSFCELAHNIGRDPFNQTFRKFRFKTQWIGSVQPEKFRKNGSTFWGGPLFPVGPVGILVEWIAPIVFWTARSVARTYVGAFDWLVSYNGQFVISQIWN